MKVQKPAKPTSWLGLATLFCVFSTHIVWFGSVRAQTVGMADASDIAELARQPSTADRTCTSIARAPWPTLPASRRAQLQRMESARAQCLGSAEFLATLGGLWLEEQEPSQAMIWLERSLMLDPHNLGAQADLALALASLGQPDAVRSLALAWVDRTDVPANLRQRVFRALPIKDATQLPVVRLGRTSNGDWATHREATVMLGYESNLDHSPKLSEITLTVPDGPIDLKLAKPLEPRPGAALSSDLSWQLATSPQPGRIFRGGVRLGARAAPSDSNTDWQHAQGALSASQQWGAWRGQTEVSATWVGGALNEPYRLTRLSVKGERDALGCVLRLSVDRESRRQTATPLANSRTTSALWNSQCPFNGGREWTWGIAARASVDRPVDPERSGGTQRQSSLGARLTGTFGSQIRFDITARHGLVRDDAGYSPLLENNARREMRQSQVSLELISPLAPHSSVLAGADAVLQVQAVQQRSNIPVFRYQAISAYSGIRWAW